MWRGVGRAGGARTGGERDQPGGLGPRPLRRAPMLARGGIEIVDRQVESASDSDAMAARLVAQEFDAYLDLVGQDGAAMASLSLADSTCRSSRASRPMARRLS